jgi:hypothetical protein
MPEHKTTGLLMGLVVCEHGETFIAVSIHGQQTLLSIDHAGFIFDQLGEHLNVLGYFDEDEEEQTKEIKRVAH